MAYVGDVLHVGDLVPTANEQASDAVGHQVGPQVSNVGVAVHRRAAGVHSGDAGLQRNEFLDLVGESVVDTDHALPLVGLVPKILSLVSTICTYGAVVDRR